MLNYDLPPGNYLPGGQEYLVDECPSCGKRKHFYFNLDKKVGWCHVCHFRIRGHKEFMEAFGGSLETRRASPVVIEGDRQGILGRSAYWTDNAWDNDEARIFLISRKVTEIQSREIPIQYVEQERAITVPIDSVSPEFATSYIYRRFSLAGSKWMVLPGVDKGHYGFGLKFLDNSLEKIVLFEGTFDLLATGMLGVGAAILGTNVNEAWLVWLKRRYSEVILWLDPDEAGISAAGKLKKRMSAWGIKASIYQHSQDPKNLNPYHPAVQFLRGYIGAGMQ